MSRDVTDEDLQAFLAREYERLLRRRLYGLAGSFSIPTYISLPAPAEPIVLGRLIDVLLYLRSLSAFLHRRDVRFFRFDEWSLERRPDGRVRIGAVARAVAPGGRPPVLFDAVYYVDLRGPHPKIEMIDYRAVEPAGTVQEVQSGVMDRLLALTR